MNAKDYLESIMYTRKEVDNWFKGKAGIMEKFDGELGWLFRNGRFERGLDRSMTTYNHLEDGLGPRRIIMYAEKKCRINTYGNSFTHCSQVNDGETWQEILAAHLCEPIRNFGVGGYSVYQAYRRMKREENRTPAEYIIFNIYDDDHYRNLAAWRNICEGYTPESRNLLSLSPTLPYVKVNPATGEFLECENPCPTKELVYNLCDLGWICKAFKDDFVLKIAVACKNIKEGTPEMSYGDISDLASVQGIHARVDSVEDLVETVNILYTRAAIFASMRIVEKIEEFAEAHGKRVLYVLSRAEDNIAKKIKEGRCFDEDFVNFLQRKKLPYIDLMEKHMKEFEQFKIDAEEYLNRYYVGHHNPYGNFFTAFAIKNKLVDMLDPKPLPYQNNSLKPEKAPNS